MVGGEVLQVGFVDVEAWSEWKRTWVEGGMDG